MNNTMLKTDANYTAWLKGIKQSFTQTQLKAAVSVNTALLQFYWKLGSEIVVKQKSSHWGDGFLTQLSQVLLAKFLKVKGFSKRNLELIRALVRFWSQQTIAKQPVSQLAQIPWGHNLVIFRKCQTTAEALFYLNSTLQHRWSRNVLFQQIESGLWQREDTGRNSRPNIRPSREGGNPNIPHAGQILSVREPKTCHSRAGGNPAGPSRHSRAGGNPNIGLLLCKEKDKLVAEYARTDVNKPIGISAYQLTQALPDNLKSSLPSIEKIEAELARDLGVGHE